MIGPRTLAILLAGVALAGAASADSVHLVSGEELAGTVAHLGGGSLVLTVPGRGNLILPWAEVERVEFQAASRGGPLPLDEMAWNNALVQACRSLESLSPLATLLVDLGLTWTAFAFGNYLEDHCGQPGGFSVSCSLAAVGLAKTVWDVLTFPKRRAALQAEIGRLWEIGRANGFVFRGCHVSENAFSMADLR